MDTPAALARFIATRDRRVAKRSWNDSPVSRLWNALLEFGHVTVGGRATCGPRVDASWLEFVAWNEVIAKANQMGIEISVEPIKQANSWATKSGGFWEENKYRLVATTEESSVVRS